MVMTTMMLILSLATIILPSFCKLFSSFFLTFRVVVSRESRWSELSSQFLKQLYLLTTEGSCLEMPETERMKKGSKRTNEEEKRREELSHSLEGKSRQETDSDWIEVVEEADQLRLFLCLIPSKPLSSPSFRNHHHPRHRPLLNFLPSPIVLIIILLLPLALIHPLLLRSSCCWKRDWLCTTCNQE